MFVRLTFCKFTPGSAGDVNRIYNQEIVPEVKAQKGNLGIRMLEPLNKGDDFISVSEWSTQADADAYENSGLYKTLVAKLGDFMAGQPVLKAYTAEEALVAAT